MRSETEGWQAARRRTVWWSIVLSLATLVMLTVIAWPEWVSLVRCLWWKECY